MGEEFFKNGQESTEEDHARFNSQLFGGGGKSSGQNVAPTIPPRAKKTSQHPTVTTSTVTAQTSGAAVAPGQTIGAALQRYESMVWASGDVLYAHGVKLSEAPDYMMPFFALMLVESRILRLRAEKIAQIELSGEKFDPQKPEHADWLVQSMANTGFGHHPTLARTGKGLGDVCLVPGGNFFNRLMDYLEEFDPVTRELLGVDDGGAHFLGMREVARKLDKKQNSPLYHFALKWSQIDLTSFDNSEVTTLEEHIKRKWADISADTAGEQYTPSDVIELACQIAIGMRKRNPKAGDICDVYDLACGGGNFLFAAEDALREAFPDLSVRVRGQEINDRLFALSAIESRFRVDAEIAYGNTLTNDHFVTDRFSVIVANPPYGQPWNTFEGKVTSDATGRFAENRLPTKSDSQMLFLQHAAFHLAEDGVGVIVHSGSSLFSGDAGSGESETRKWLLAEQDIVEAIVQLPSGEFFNTGINTYLWVLNKDKPDERKGKVLMVDASQRFSKLKKNMNKKSNEIDEANRSAILRIFENFGGESAKVVDVDDLLYNKVDIEVQRKDESGKGVAADTDISKELAAIQISGRTWFKTDGGESWLCDAGTMATASIPPAKEMESLFKQDLKDEEAEIVLLKRDGSVVLLNIEDSLVSAGKSVENALTLGKGSVKMTTKVAKAKGIESLQIKVVVGPFVEKDSETIPYSSNKTKNDKLVNDFLKKWVHEPWKIVGAKVGCEINFNRLFPKKTEIRPTTEILAELGMLDAEMRALEAEFTAALKGG